MCDQYNSKIAAAVGRLNGHNKYAVTISADCTLYSVPESEVSDRWRRHEDCHKQQIRLLGWFKFMRQYLAENARLGYEKNRFEIEARKAELNTPLT